MNWCVTRHNCGVDNTIAISAICNLDCRCGQDARRGRVAMLHPKKFVSALLTVGFALLQELD